MPPEKSAYALARYSRSPDSIVDSVEWVRSHDSQKFLESYYFEYGHASIADLGHQAVSFEGISELAATEIEDEQLWDGQAKSTRYQNFGNLGFVTPPELDEEQAAQYQQAGAKLIDAYKAVHAAVTRQLESELPRPEDMKAEAYRRTIEARAFDVARYLLFFGIPTNVGQVVSIRTLEKQVRRMRASEYAELRQLGDEVAEACAQPPACVWHREVTQEAVAPTLARHGEPHQHRAKAQADLAAWAAANLGSLAPIQVPDIDLLRPHEETTEIAATLLYPVTELPYRQLQELVAGWPRSRRMEVIDTALKSRERKDELLREFRSAPFVYDMVMDIGAYRDMHRHRRCQQFRQAYRGNLGYDTPDALVRAGVKDLYDEAMQNALRMVRELPAPAGQYLLPFGARSRFLFKMDFAEAEYISRLRSGVKGHFSYRRVAWEMKQAMLRLEPELGALIKATPPEVEDPLKR